jgi:hypothetical protein
MNCLKQKPLIPTFLNRVLLVSIAFGLSSPLANADLPTTDPVTGYLRKEFAEGKVPTFAQLEMGKQWNCKAYDAFQGSTHEEDEMPLVFSRVDGLIRGFYSWPGTPSIVEDFAFSGTSLAGNEALKDGPETEAIRVSTAGDLIVETSRPLAASIIEKWTAEQALFNAGNLAVGYSVCPISDVTSVPVPTPDPVNLITTHSPVDLSGLKMGNYFSQNDSSETQTGCYRTLIVNPDTQSITTDFKVQSSYVDSSLDCGVVNIHPAKQTKASFICLKGSDTRIGAYNKEPIVCVQTDNNSMPGQGGKFDILIPSKDGTFRIDTYILGYPQDSVPYIDYVSPGKDGDVLEVNNGQAIEPQVPSTSYFITGSGSGT